MTGADSTVELAIKGEQGAWRQLYQLHAPAVRRVVSGFSGLSAADAEDLVQETFVRAYSSIGGLRNPKVFRAWLLSIARSRCLNRLRSLSRGQQLAAAYQRDPEVVTAVQWDPEGLDRARRIQVVRDLISDLPEGPEAETVRLFYIEGRLSAKQIADKLQVGKSTVTMRLERFRARVKARLVAVLMKPEKGVA